jgi:hypothetical protein
MSNKTYHIKPSPDYRKAKSDLVYHYALAGVMILIGLAALVVKH